MNKFILGGVMLVALAFVTAAAQQPTEGPRTNQMPMMMQNCPMAAMMGSVDVKYEPTETGARLIFTPKDPKQLSELQTRLREMAERMSKGEMMHGPIGNTDRDENHDIHHPAK